MINTRETHYISSLTPMRGIAAIWVMFFHIDVIIYYRDFGALISREETGILSKGYLWVDFFFILSGFIISHVYGAGLTASFMKWGYVKEYLRARFSRIYPLHIFTILLLLPFVAIAPLIKPEIVDGSWTSFLAWSALIDNIILTTSMNQHVYLSWNIVSWSIAAEWWAYLAACLIIPFMFNKGLFRTILSGTIGLTIIALLAHWRGTLDITYDYGWIRCIAEFIIGCSLYQLYTRSFAKSWLSNSTIVYVLLLLVAIIFHFKFNDLWIMPVFAILVLSIAYNTGTVKNILEKPVLKYLGDISYSIYMMHSVWFIFFWFTIPFLRSELGITQLSLWMKIVYSISFIFLTIFSSHFTYKYVEVKAREFLRRR